MRSKLSTMTALMPSSMVPFAAQSRELPMPYSLPPNTTNGTPSALVFHRGIIDRHFGAVGIGGLVRPPSMPCSISFLMRMLAKVPRIMTSWLPRRAP